MAIKYDKILGKLREKDGGEGSVEWGNIDGNIQNQGDLTQVLQGKADTEHTHTEADITDLDKYTQEEVNTLLTGKADTEHTHTEADITDLDKYSQEEVDTLLLAKVSKAGDTMTGDLTFDDASIVNPNKVAFNSLYTPNGETAGTLYWNPADGTLDVKLYNDVTLQTGQELHFYGKASEDIEDGDVVQYAGFQGDHILFKKAVGAEVDAQPELLLGLATQDIDANEWGYVTWFGQVRNVYTYDWEVNDILYFDKSSGQLTNVVPTAPDRKIYVAAVQKVQTGTSKTGVLLVRPTWRERLSELSDITLTDIADDDILSWDTNKWTNKSLLDLKDDLDINDEQRVMLSAGRAFGGEISTNAEAGKVNISAGAGWTKNESAGLEDVPQGLLQGQGSDVTYVTWEAIEGFELAGVGYNLIFWDASEGGFNVALKENFYSVFDFTRDFTIGRVYFDGTVVTIRICGMNAWNFNRRVQMFGGERFPVERATGLLLSSTGTRNIAITSGVIWAELVNRFTIFPDGNFDSSGTDRFIYYYRDGLGGWTTQVDQSQINNTQWDNGSGTLQTLTANRYGVHWVYVVHDSTTHIVFGQGDYTLAQAEASQPPAVIPGLLASYANLVGRIIVQRNSNTLIVESAYVTNFTPAQIQEHNDLTGLQGGTTDEYYHLTATQITSLHPAVTVTDTNSIDLTLSGQDIKGDIRTQNSTTVSLSVNTDGLKADLDTTLKSNYDTAYSHTLLTSNPHSVTKTQVGLGNVTDDAQLKIASNLSDLNSAELARSNLGLGSIATLNTIDISSNTNLAVSGAVTLTEDTVGLDETKITHNNLAGLQGGAVGEYNHLTNAQITNLNNQSGTNTGDITVTDTTTIDFTLTGQSLSGTVKENGITHNNLSGLTTGDPHTQYVSILGREGGQTINGGTVASDNLKLTSTSDETKGNIEIGNLVYNEETNTFGPTSFKQGSADESEQVILLEQEKDDACFISFKSTVGTDDTMFSGWGDDSYSDALFSDTTEEIMYKPIVEAPLNTYYGKARISVNGECFWIPIYR